MKTRRSAISGVSVLAGASLLLLSFAQVSEVQAQANNVDSRWLAWVGCWEGAGISENGSEGALLVCFRPVEGGAAVESLTYAEGNLVGSEILRADGTSTPIAEGGCEGSRTMDWSADGRLVFLSSQMNCGEGVTRSTRGVFTYLPGRMGWSNVLAAQIGNEPPLLEIRSFVPASPALLIEYGVADPAAGIELAVNTARLNAGAPLTVEAVAEIVSRAGAAAAGGVLVERDEVLDPDAAMLRSLARSGVPGEVLDIIVALSYPDRFQFAGGSPNALPETASGRDSDFAFVPYVAPWGASSRVYTRSGQAYYVGRNPLVADPYGAAFYGVDFYGYPMYQFPYSMYPAMGWPYGAFPFRAAISGSTGRFPRYIVTQPPVVVVGTPQPVAPPGRVDRDSGFSGGTSSVRTTPTTTNATPRSSTSSGSSSSGSSSSGSSSSGPSTSAASAPSSDSGNSTAEPRRAIPRP
jgi:hypothetical protein